jgi:hypothetical protein
MRYPIVKATAEVADSNQGALTRTSTLDDHKPSLASIPSERTGRVVAQLASSLLVAGSPPYPCSDYADVVPAWRRESPGADEALKPLARTE